MSRLDIMTPSHAQTVIDGLYRDVERRIAASPPGLCPVDLAKSFLDLCHAQTCGKCVPCRIGLGQLSELMEQVLEGEATMETISIIERVARVIVNSADCAIGRDAARLVLDGVQGFRDDYEEHILRHRCLGGMREPVPCVALCPAGVDIPGYLVLIKYGRYADAVRLIRKDNPFPSACAYICEHPCEARCRRNMIDDAVNIRGLKRYAVDNAGYVPQPDCAEPTGKKVAVIGGGPSGLSCAYYLAVKGYPVTVFEKGERVGGMLTRVIPSFRLEKDVVEAEIDVLRQMGVEFKCGVDVGKDVTLDELRKAGYEAFYLAAGAWQSVKLGVPGEDKSGVWGGIEFLTAVNGENKPSVGKNVAVIGGGNTAMDVARAALRLGAENVTVVYRRGRDEMPASDEEIAEAEAEGVKFKFLVSPIRIKGSDGKATEVELQVMTQGEADGAGRRKSVPVEGQTETIPAGTVVAAIGQRVDWGDMLAGSRVQLRRNGAAMADRVTLQTMESDIFVGGDALTGPSFVIDAIAEGKEAAISIHRFVQPGQSLTIGRRVKDYMELDKSEADLTGYDRAPRQSAAAADAAKARETFRDLRGTFTAEQVLKETERCLGCGATVVDQSACVGCGVCTTKCKFDAIHLVRATDAAGKVYEKLMPESGKNLARRVKEIAVKRVARPSAK